MVALKERVAVGTKVAQLFICDSKTTDKKTMKAADASEVKRYFGEQFIRSFTSTDSHDYAHQPIFHSVHLDFLSPQSTLNLARQEIHTSVCLMTTVK